MSVSEEYRRFVCRVWDALAKRTKSTVFYVDATHVASRCPVCMDGVLRVGFVANPTPKAFIDSRLGPGRCSRGCTETEIVGALFK